MMINCGQEQSASLSKAVCSWLKKLLEEVAKKSVCVNLFTQLISIQVLSADAMESECIMKNL